MPSVVLLSGGMDSLISWRLFYPESLPVFVDTGSRYGGRDLARARLLARSSLQVLQGPELAELPSGVAPHRNSILLAFVANKTGAHEIVVSSPRGELIWDQQRPFHRLMERVLPGVKIKNPLRRLTKAQAIARYVQEYGPGDLFLTRSCYSADHNQCGECPACVKRWIALRNNDLEESYQGDVRAHALKIARMGSLWDIYRYGLRPALEAWRAVR